MSIVRSRSSVECRRAAPLSQVPLCAAAAPAALAPVSIRPGPAAPH